MPHYTSYSLQVYNILPKESVYKQNVQQYLEKLSSRFSSSLNSSNSHSYLSWDNFIVKRFDNVIESSVDGNLSYGSEDKGNDLEVDFDEEDFDNEYDDDDSDYVDSDWLDELFQFQFQFQFQQRLFDNG